MELALCTAKASIVLDKVKSCSIIVVSSCTATTLDSKKEKIIPQQKLQSHMNSSFTCLSLTSAEAYKTV